MTDSHCYMVKPIQHCKAIILQLKRNGNRFIDIEYKVMATKGESR